jgi:hypothetical protein
LPRVGGLCTGDASAGMTKAQVEREYKKMLGDMYEDVQKNLSDENNSEEDTYDIEKVVLNDQYNCIEIKPKKDEHRFTLVWL